MEALDIFVPMAAEVKVFGKVRNLKAFTIKRTVELARILSGVHAQTKDERKGAGSDAQAIIKILTLVDEATCAKLIEVIGGFSLSEEEKARVGDMEISELSEIVKAAGEVNDFAAVFENFTQAFRNADRKGKKTLSGTPLQK